ncbi:GTP-binding protein RAD-like isoform X3 [Zootermopsis nevadensis]|uniref:GTP-binding protein RAD-like isoform X3 n=1 Tax=Zootermopsis nevadensis TaxID=136037 RepID=UPI000B8E58A9|nr:GTP-binding protein RAD-like isoform X3 [Zootermopsis nevadensis]
MAAANCDEEGIPRRWHHTRSFRSSSITASHDVAPSPMSPRRGRRAPSYRLRTASVPAVPRLTPMLGQLRRCGDQHQEYYRVRSFSITPNGVFNLGDSFKSRLSCSVNSVSSTSSNRSDVSPTRLPRNPPDGDLAPARFRVAMLGASGVGKTALTCQFTVSEYDSSLDEDIGQKIVSVMLDGREAQLEIVDHPAAEMSVETCCSTYGPDVFVVVYSVVDRSSLAVAEDMLLFLWKGGFVASRGVILAGNKADLERRREVPMPVGRKLASTCGCKFIETSSGLDHNVDELLVGILAQLQLNPWRDLEKKKKQKVGGTSGIATVFFTKNPSAK